MPKKLSLEDFIILRNKALSSDDENDWIAYYITIGQQIPSDRIVFLASVHKARTAIKTLDIEKRLISKKWLTEHNMQSFDDGELA